MEALAAREALHFNLNCGCRRINLEGDAKRIIDCLNSSHANGDDEIILQDCLDKRRGQPEVASLVST